MGFSWRGRGSKALEVLPDAEATGPELAANMSEAITQGRNLSRFKSQHRWDPFLDMEKIDAVDEGVTSGDPEKQHSIENSPYPEVRSAVSPVDEDIPVNTIRAWFIGALLCTVIAACNVLLGLRRSPIVITATVAQLIAYPLGTGWARYVPNLTFSLFSKEFQLNHGPFNNKEHTIITVMTAAGASTSYAIEIFLAQEVFYGQFFRWGFQILVIISTQAMGFGLAGVMRRYLVWPAAMVWPMTLITCTVINSLHDHTPSDPTRTNGWRIGRYKFFLIVAVVTFVWEWIPQVLAIFLQLFIFVCWIAPNNVAVNQVFGGQTGLGLLPISFDWSVVSGFLGSPLSTPAFAILNVMVGLVFMVVCCIGLAYGGPEQYRYLPISANANFDHFGAHYNTSRVLTPELLFNQTAYEEYSPLMLSAAFSLSYGISFATLISTISYVALFYGPQIISRARNINYEEPDVHLKLMRKYREAPEWWFLLTFAVSFAFGMIASQVWDTFLPWWAYIIAILISIVFILPIGIIQAITNQQTGLNVITELIIGFMLPGRPIAMMLFKSWGYMTCYNGLSYIADMKIGHYMKIPPRTMFAAQFFAVFWLSFVQIATYNFVRGNIKGVCTPEQKQGLTCPSARAFYNASVIWGVIGPAKLFGKGALYSWSNWFWLIGAILPAIQYVLVRFYPRTFLRYVYFPTIFGAAGMIPPATTWYIGQWIIVGLIFNYWIRKRWFGWWSRYNYVNSGALDIGTALCVLCVGLGLGLSERSFPDWWGNTVPFSNLDATEGAVSKKLGPDEDFFGPREWN